MRANPNLLITFNRPTYLAMSNIASEEIWAMLVAVSASIQLYIVIAENFKSTFARWFAGWNALLWLFTIIGMLESVYPPPAAIGGEIALTVLALWIFIRPYFLAIMYGRVYERVK